MKKTILLLALLLLLVPVTTAQQSKISTKDTEDYRDISVTPEGFQIKDPYALPVYEPKSTSLLPFSKEISSLLNSYLGNLLSNFDVKEAFALRILFQDVEPILSFIGNILSLPITLLALPLLSIARLIKLPLDILEFSIRAILDPIFSIPSDELALLRSFVSSLRNALRSPLKFLKPLEFLIYTPDPLRAFPYSLSLMNSFSALYSSSLQPLISLVSAVMDYIPFLNVIKALIEAYVLPMLRAPLNLTSLLSPYADDPHVSSLMNMISLPFSLPLMALQQLISLTKDLASVILLPVLFVLRISLTPLLILFNFVKHSLEGWKEFVNFTSLFTYMPTLIFIAPVILFALLAFVISIPLSILLAPIAAIGIVFVGVPLIAMLLPVVVIGLLGLVLGLVISFLLPALVLFVLYFLVFLATGVIYAIAAIGAVALLGLVVGALVGLVVGGVVGLIIGLIIGAVVGAVAGAIVGFIIAGIVGIVLWLASVVTGGTSLIVSLILDAAGLIIGLVAGLIIGGIVGVIVGLIAGAVIGIIIGAIVGLIAGAIIGLIPAAIILLLSIPLAFVLGAMFGFAGLFMGLFAGPFIAIFLAPISAISFSYIGVFVGIVRSIISIPLLILLSPVLLPLLTILSVPALIVSITAIGAIGGAVIWSSILTAIIGLVSSAVSAIIGLVITALQTIIPISIPAASVVAIVLLLAFGALALISVISPELFRVLVPPELTAMLARTISLPAGITRIINGFTHLPFDLMKAIAVLDAPAMAAMTADGGGGSGNVEAALPAEFLVYNDTNIEDLSSEDMDLAKDLISSGFESGEYAVESLQKIPGDAKGVLIVWVSANSAYIQTGVTAVDVIGIISRLSDNNPDNDPDAGDYLELAGSATGAAEGIVTMGSQTGALQIPTAASKVLGVAGTAFTVGKVSYEGYQAVQDYNAGNISVDELGEALTGSVVEGTIGVVSYFFPPAGLVYYGADAVSRLTTGEELDHWIYVGEKGWTTYTITEVIPAAKEFGYTTGDIWIAEAEAEAKAGEALIRGIQDLAARVAVPYTEFLVRVLSIFSIAFLLMLSPSTEVDI